MPPNELSFDLPGLFADPHRPRTAREWEYNRKPELLELYSRYIYGRTPDGGSVTAIATISHEEDVLDGLAERLQLRLTLSGPRGSKTANLLVYIPRSATPKAPAPIFVGLNFPGNHATTGDDTIEVTSGWANDDGWHDSTAERGAQERRWPVHIPLSHGYAVATMHCAELEGDFPGLATQGVRGLFHSAEQLEAPSPDMWGTIGAWAWGLSRILDALQTLPKIDATSAIVHGHSRLGKTALWAAAQDLRFAAAISNNSGCVGASLFRHEHGETIRMITDRFPHWFAPNLNSYRDSPAGLPIDQHHLLAMLAPRPVHVASATLDFHADQRGEYLATLHASPVFELYGFRGTLPPNLARGGANLSLQTTDALETPQPGVRVGGRLSYHMRDGIHDVLSEDWLHFVAFAQANGIGRRVKAVENSDG